MSQYTQLHIEAPQLPGLALCTQVDGELWFPEKGVNAYEPKQICRMCPVVVECAQWALDHDDAAAFGVWGGLSERERRQYRRERDNA